MALASVASSEAPRPKALAPGRTVMNKVGMGCVCSGGDGKGGAACGVTSLSKLHKHEPHLPTGQRTGHGLGSDPQHGRAGRRRGSGAWERLQRTCILFNLALATTNPLSAHVFLRRDNLLFPGPFLPVNQTALGTVGACPHCHASPPLQEPPRWGGSRQVQRLALARRGE